MRNFARENLMLSQESGYSPAVLVATKLDTFNKTLGHLAAESW